MASFTATTTDPSIYTNYVNGHLSIDKLDGINYDTWASYIKLCLKSQGYVDLLTQSEATIAENEISRWLKIDAQLCIILKSIILSSLKQIFLLMYNNDTQRFYGVLSKSSQYCCPQMS